MKLNEFISDFAGKHQLQHIDEINGIIKAQINNDIFLVETVEVNE